MDYEVVDTGYTTPCHLYTGRISHFGYGVYKNRPVHVLTWEEKNGPVPQGKVLHHKCVIRKCINPDHVEPLTPKEHRLAHQKLVGTKLLDIGRLVDYNVIRQRGTTTDLSFLLTNKHYYPLQGMEEQDTGVAPVAENADELLAEAMEKMKERTAHFNGETYIKADPPRGKKVDQVARIIKTLQDNPGVPYDFEQLCLSVGQKYPQDLHAAVIALEMTEYVDRYWHSREVGHRAKTYYVWVGPLAPEANDE